MRNLGWTLRSTVLAATVMMVSVGPAQGGVIFNFTGATLGGGSRWDAAARTINMGGTNYERSLDAAVSVTRCKVDRFKRIATCSRGRVERPA